MKLAWLWLGACLFASAQTDARGTLPKSDFEDLARRAASALGSDPRQAIALCHQALALNPSWAEGWFDLGAASYSLGEYRESAKAFDRASELAPRKGAVWGFRGLAEYQLGESEQALADIQHGEELGLPDNRDFVSTVHNRAAIILIREKDFSAAIEQLRPLALLGDLSPETIQAFGVSALGMSYAPPSIPTDKQALVRLAGKAEWAISAGREEEARNALQELSSAYPNEPGVHYLKGIYLLSSDPVAARGEFERELQVSPSHVAARVQIAIIAMRMGDPNAAVTMARDALRLQPDNPVAHAALARAYMQRNENTKAVPELLAAAKLAPLNPQIHLYLEQVYRRLGRSAEAEKEKAAFVHLRSGQHTVSQ